MVIFTALRPFGPKANSDLLFTENVSSDDCQAAGSAADLRVVPMFYIIIGPFESSKMLHVTFLFGAATDAVNDDAL